MSLSDKFAKWEILTKEIEAIEAEIKAEVLALGETQKYGNVKATYSKGRGSYDYVQIATEIKAPQAVIDSNTKQVIDWKSVVEAVGAPKDVKEKFYTESSNPTVSLKMIV